MDVLLYVFSEVNFVKPETATSKMNTALNRLASRFKKAAGYFGLVIIDSSAESSGSFVDEFIESKCNPQTTKVVRSKIWEVKPSVYGHKGWFKVYLGDSVRDAFVIQGSEKPGYELPESLERELDPDRILEVPNELHYEFAMDLNLSLNDHAGISTTSNDYFIQDRKALDKVFALPLKNQEIIEIDFFSNEKIYDRLYNSVQDIPKDKVLSIRFDIGIVNDYTGLSVCYFDDFIVKDKKSKTRIPKFVNIVTAAIGRIPGQETSISKLYEFVKDLSKTHEIGAVTCDQFGSKQLLQDLKREGFNAFEISVDRTAIPYQNLKQAIYEGRIQLPQSKLLQRELRELQASRKNGKMKVDHPEATSADMLTYGKGSKDCADALAGAIEAILRDLDTFTYLAKPYVQSQYIDHMKSKVIFDKNKVIKDMKKIAKTGGLERFYSKQSEREEFLKGLDIKIPIPSKYKGRNPDDKRK